MVRKRSAAGSFFMLRALTLTLCLALLLLLLPALSGPSFAQGEGEGEAKTAREGKEKQGEGVEAGQDEHAGYFGPLSLSNLDPLHLAQPSLPPLFGIGRRGRAGLDLGLDLASQAYLESGGGGQSELDVELYRLTFTYRQPARGGGGWGVGLPFYLAGPGFMDRIITSWHDFFGLPNGDRDLLPANQSRVVLIRGETTLISQQGSWGGVGDPVVYGALPIWDYPKRELVLGAGVSIPLGDEGRLLGLGEPAMLAGLSYRRRLGRWHVFLEGEFAHHSKGVLGRRGEAAGVETGRSNQSYLLALEYRAHRRMSYLAQLNFGTNLITSGIPGLDRDWLMGSLAVRYRLGDGRVLSVGFSEDLRVGTAPDFTAFLHLHLGL